MADKLKSRLNAVLARVNTGQHTARNLDIIKRYLGFDLPEGQSMQQAGQPYNLTRESVRQIMNRFTEGLLEISPQIPGLDAALDEVLRHMPASADVIIKSLAQKGLVEDDTSIDLIIQSAKHFHNRQDLPSLVKIGETVFVLSPEDAKKGIHKEVISLANKRISRNGAVSIDELADTLEGVRHDARYDFASAVMGALPTSLWINDGWIYYGSNGRNCLRRRLKKIFFMMDEVPLEKLRSGLERSLNGSETLPRTVLIDMLKVDPVFDINNDIVTCRESLASEKSLLRKFEREIVERISEMEDHKIREKQLEDKLVNSDKDKYSFSMALSQSPLIYRVERGVYSLVGKPRTRT